MPGDVVLLAAGAWTPLLAPHLARAMWPVAQPVFHLLPRDPAAWRPPRFTVWAAAIATMAGTATRRTLRGSSRSLITVPAAAWTPTLPARPSPATNASSGSFSARESSRARRRAARGLEDLSLLRCVRRDFWIGRDPDRPGLAVAAGDSGHGFKFAPVLGDVIADAIEEKPSRFTARFPWRMPADRNAESARHGLS